jgi:mannosyltransferase OCH1-like enzyme
MIPKNIFQTHKSIAYVKTKSKLIKSVYSWKKYKNDFNYYFYNDYDCDTFMKTYFFGKVYNAYQKLPMSVMKADLWRYCIIYHYGGIYADVDTICITSPNIFINDSLLCIVPENSSHLCQWIFSAPPNSPILKYIIELSTERILNINEIKGEHIIHFLTGPAVFTDGIEKYLKENNKITFEDKKKYFKYPESILRVFNHEIFHEKIVKHLFTGMDKDGWSNERFRKLM